MKFLLSLLPYLALCGMLQAAEYEARTFEAPGNLPLPYRLLQPAPHQGKVPLVLLLHGAGERGTDNSAQLKHGATRFQKENDQFPCYVLVPQCPKEQKWADIDWSVPEVKQAADTTAPMKSLLGLLDALPMEFPDIDLDRIYVTGLSMGGYGTWDLLARFPERFAAAAPVCGGADPVTAAAMVKIPIWNFHGDRDPTVIVEKSRTIIAAIEKAGGHPLYSEYPSVRHDSWKNAYAEPELLRWLFAQRRGQAMVSFEKAAAPFAQPPSQSFPSTGPVQEGIWFRTLWQEKRQQWAKEASADQGAIVFLGDSITQGWDTLAQDFSMHKVANRGISGDTTRGVLYRLQGDVLDVHPSAVALLIGTNDLGLGAEPEVAAANVKLIIEKLHEANPKMPIILCEVMPSTAAKNRPAAKLQALNELLKEAVANDSMVTLVGTYSLFANEAGDAKLEEFPDLLHPNAAGYGKWREVLEAAFTKLGLTAPTAQLAPRLDVVEAATVLEVQQDGSVQWDHATVTQPDLIRRLKEVTAASPDHAILLRAGEDVPYKFIVSTLDVCRESKVGNVALATAEGR